MKYGLGSAERESAECESAELDSGWSAPSPWASLRVVIHNMSLGGGYRSEENIVQESFPLDSK